MDRFSEELEELFGDQHTYLNLQKNIKNITVNDDKSCEHSYVSMNNDNGSYVCNLCGKIETFLNFDAEWRYYGNSDNKSSQDPSRCHFTKSTTKGSIDDVFINAKLDHLQLSIKKKITQKYEKIVGNNTVRGKGRKAIVAACLVYVLRESGDIRDCEAIRKLFDISKKEMSKGLSRYYIAFPESRTKSPKPIDLLIEIMNKTKVEMSHYPKIYYIAQCLENADTIFNRSNPRSVASAIVYLYLCLNPKYKRSIGMNKSKFASTTELSDITITKLIKKAAEVLECQSMM